MRIIKFIFKSVVLLIIIGGVGFVLAREILLMIGVGKIKSSLSTLRSIAIKQSYFAQCKEKGSVFVEGDDPAIMQLRFISDDEYVLEILCSQFSIDPILIETGKLPAFTKKTRGNSGVIWGDDRSGITLEVFNRRKSVGVEDRTIKVFSEDGGLGSGPVTSCAGYGYSCCKFESEQGQGDQLDGSSDCPKSCFRSCKSRPVVLAFNTQPVLDLSTRSMSIATGEDVTFSFVIDAGSSQAVTVLLDYGDGHNDTFKTDKKTVTHNYQCAKGTCSYRVKLTAADEVGTSTVDLPITSMVVLVKGKL